MAKFKYDVSGEEHELRKPIEIPEKRIWIIRVKEVLLEQPKGKDARLKITYQIDEAGPSKGYQMYEYINLVQKNVKWKLDEFLLAVGIDTTTKEQGELDTDKLQGKRLRARIIHEEGNDGVVRGRARSVFALGDEDEADSDQSEPEDEEVVVDDTPADAEETVDESEVDWDALGEAADGEDSDAMETLVAYAEAAGVDPDEFPTWAELAALLANGGSNDEPEAEAEATPEADPGEGGEGDDYDTWELDDLRSELKNRELTATGPKSALVARLRANDANPFA